MSVRLERLHSTEDTSERPKYKSSYRSIMNGEVMSIWAHISYEASSAVEKCRELRGILQLPQDSWGELRVDQEGWKENQWIHPVLNDSDMAVHFLIFQVLSEPEIYCPLPSKTRLLHKWQLCKPVVMSPHKLKPNVHLFSPLTWDQSLTCGYEVLIIGQCTFI